MKNKLWILILSLGCLLAACGDDHEESTSYLRIARLNMDFTAVGGTADIEFDAAEEVTAVSGADWCRIVEITSNKITLLIRANTDYAGRATRITISSGTHVEVVSVTQQGDIFAPDDSKKVMRLSNDATEIPVDVNSSFGYTVGISSGTDWLTVTKKEGGFRMTIDANNTETIRACIVRVKTDQGKIFDYTVYQYNPEDLLGEWKSGMLFTFWDKHIIADGLALSASPVSITGNEEEGYTLSLPFTNNLVGKSMVDPTNAIMRLKATYKDGALVVGTMQEQEGFVMVEPVEETPDENEDEPEEPQLLYGVAALVDGNNIYSKGDVGIAPILYNNQILLSYVDVSTTPNVGKTFLSLCFYPDHEFKDLKDYILFPGLEIYK